jgi:hypothetical protein
MKATGTQRKGELLLGGGGIVSGGARTARFIPVFLASQRDCLSNGSGGRIKRRAPGAG